MQRYIESPYLIEKRKMHLRLYVVVREIDPLRIPLFEDGLALLAGQPYSDNPMSEAMSTSTSPTLLCQKALPKTQRRTHICGQPS